MLVWVRVTGRAETRIASRGHMVATQKSKIATLTRDLSRTEDRDEKINHFTGAISCQSFCITIMYQVSRACYELPMLEAASPGISDRRRSHARTPIYLARVSRARRSACSRRTIVLSCSRSPNRCCDAVFIVSWLPPSWTTMEACRT